MKDVREFIRNHKKEVITGALIAGGVIAIVMLTKVSKYKIEIGTAHKPFGDINEAIDVFRKFTEVSKDAALFFEQGQYVVIDL